MGTASKLEHYLVQLEEGTPAEQLQPALPVFVTSARTLNIAGKTAPVPMEQTEAIIIKPGYVNMWENVSVLVLAPASNNRYIVGRTERNELTIADLSVSREHAYLTLAGDTLVAQDNRSTNGTFWSRDNQNYEPVAADGQRLRNMDWVRFGKIDLQVFFPTSFVDYLKFMADMYKRRARTESR